MVLDVVKKRPVNDSALAERTMLTRHDITELLAFCLNSTVPISGDVLQANSWHALEWVLQCLLWLRILL